MIPTIDSSVNSSSTQPHMLPRNPIEHVNSRGDGRFSGVIDIPGPSPFDRSHFEKQFLSGQSRSLSGIASRAFTLGFVLNLSILATLYLLSVSSSFWRLPSFLATLSGFHFLEFWTTARYNTPAAQVSSFLLTQNGSAYSIAHSAAMLECLVTNYFFAGRVWLPASLSLVLIWIGLAMIIVGQVIRTVAMAQAGTNFNHIVQHHKRNEHQLVTTGLYRYLRHPSYFGFFWWGLGTQLLLGNAICFVGYGIVLWRFFSKRIEGEEQLLMIFFGDDYKRFKKVTGVGIPFVR